MPEMTIAEALREGLREELRRDPRVFLLGEDIGVPGGFGGAFTVTLGLAEEFGRERVRDTPISEAAIAGVAIGAAINGMRPVADVQYGDFLFNMMDQLVNQAAKLRYMSGGTLAVPMVMRAPVGATARGSQHAQSPEAFFTHVPGLKVVVPSTPHDARGLLRSSIRDDDPVLFFEVKEALEARGFTPILAEVQLQPKTTVHIEEEKAAQQVLKLVELLEDHDDVNDVFANFDIPDELLEALM